MKVAIPSKDNFILYEPPVINENSLSKFRIATGTQFTKKFPLTFPTVFRKPEFDWLDRLEVDMRELLHTDQQYFYFSALELGEKLQIKTWVSSFKERKLKDSTLYIVGLTSEMNVEGVKKIEAITTFVVKSAHSSQKVNS